MTSLVADYGTSSGSESEQDARWRSEDHHSGNTLKGNEDKEDDDDEDDDDDKDDNDDDNDPDNDDDNGGGNDDDDDDEGDGDDEGDDSDDDRNRNSDDENHHRQRKSEEDERGMRPRANGTIKGKISSDDAQLPLPTPNFAVAPKLKTSVFANPFVEAERAKSAILEKHVKMTPTLDDTKMINGRKICWNYRKGRCRFGHNCTFAHDSDLHRSAAELEASRTPEETLICQTNFANQTVTSNDEEQEIDQENNQLLLQKRKKRPGLAQNLVPGKKVLKLYKAQQAKSVGR